ncbi:hypothetical protein I7I51_02848 [Histoplasma capsulatum]|uniref:Uncharacterized protein n=1 Tax=Ajellomyces capsulatus TaxID=5037 RepID=A0A8A1MJ97_AJECA|nr:predicted protein [Histoplasma mississippiense (nom. inval.)]EDN05097.1 predicted protein [Histoplasma mississippiense (nom. inval.)]QSS66658.1 hypothetical protein I7I51_02848 [Histoplasma capsulatum]
MFFNHSQPLEETVYESLWERSVDIFSKTNSKASRVRRLEAGRAVLQRECLANNYANRLGLLLFRIELDEMILSVPDNKCRQGVGKATIAYEDYAKEAGVSVGWEKGSVDVDLLLKFVKDKYPEREETFHNHDRLCAKAILDGLKAYGWENDEIIESKGEMLTAVRELVPRANPLGDLSHRINSHSDAPMRALAAAATQCENTYQLQPMDSVRAAPLNISSSDAQSRLNPEDCQAYQSPTIHTFPNANVETCFAFSSPRQPSIPHSPFILRTLTLTRGLLFLDNLPGDVSQPSINPARDFGPIRNDLLVCLHQHPNPATPRIYFYSSEQIRLLSSKPEYYNERLLVEYK